jgi:hypothetical protein
VATPAGNGEDAHRPDDVRRTGSELPTATHSVGVVQLTALHELALLCASCAWGLQVFPPSWETLSAWRVAVPTT